MKKKSLLLGALLLGLSVASAAEVRTLSENGVNVSVEKLIEFEGVPSAMSNNYVGGIYRGVRGFRLDIKSENKEYLTDGINLTEIHSINNGGTAAGMISELDEITGSSFSRPIIWHPDGRVEELPHVVEGIVNHFNESNGTWFGDVFTYVNGINEKGDIAGHSMVSGFFDGNGLIAWRVVNGNFEVLESPGTLGSHVTGMSNDGKVSGYSIVINGVQTTTPVYWSAKGDFNMIGGEGKLLSLKGNEAVGQYVENSLFGQYFAASIDLKSHSVTPLYEHEAGAAANGFTNSGNYLGFRFTMPNGDVIGPSAIMLRTKFDTVHDITSLIADTNTQLPIPRGLKINNNEIFTAGKMFKESSDEIFSVYKLIVE